MSHFLLITKVVFVQMKMFTALQIERRNGFQKYCKEILKNHSRRLTYIHQIDTNEGLVTQKLTNFDMRDDMFSCQDCTE